MRVVIFGFQRFGDEPTNPSEVAVNALHGRVVHGVRVEAVVLPVVYETAFPTLAARLEAAPAPLSVMGVGQGHARFQIEQTARNQVGASLDNMGARLSVVEEHAPGALHATWDSEALRAAVAQVASGAPVTLSDDAGDYLCNHTMFRVLRWSDGKVPTGFLHVPKLSIVTQHEINRAVEAALFALVNAALPSLLG